MLFEVRTDRSWGTIFTVTELSPYSLFVLCCREFNSEGKLGGGGEHMQIKTTLMENEIKMKTLQFLTMGDHWKFLPLLDCDS